MAANTERTAKRPMDGKKLSIIQSIIKYYRVLKEIRLMDVRR
jgi:hypothetical protein